MQLEKSLSLEHIEQEFMNWRQERRNSREAIPQDLLDKARQLYPTYKKSVICERLKLSDKKLKEILDSSLFVIAQMPQAPAEIKAELPTKLPALPEAFAEFRLKTPNRELSIKIPCDYLGQCFSHMAGLL
jgi:hypothetical protein